MNSLTMVEKAKKTDLAGMLDLVKELAKYEHAPDEVIATLADYEQNFERKVFDGFVTKDTDGKITGMAIYYFGWSTWKGKMLYLEDFVVSERVRGQGLGHLIFDRLLQEAKNQGCVMMKWQVLDWNIPAIRFYEKYMTDFDKGWWNGRIFFK